MRTTVRLNDELMRQVKQYAAEHDKTLTTTIEEALREKLARKTTDERPPFKIKTFDGGGLQPGVDLSNNAKTLDIMDGLE